MMKQVCIKSVRKLAASISERSVSAEETHARAARIAAHKGVTRLADITGLDRLGIPVYTAVVPKSDDAISVYNGKGTAPVDSSTGALMEAIERQTALYADLNVIEESYRDLRRGKVAVADPRSFNHKLRANYSEDRPYWWVEGHDLIANETVFVPAGLTGYGQTYTGSGSPYVGYSTNGLASGNCFEEAVAHALCELIEGDAWTLAELRSQWIPHAQREMLLGKEAAADGWDDPAAYPRIELRNAGPPISELMAKFENADLPPIVRDITSDFGIACVIASVADDSVPGFPQAHSGVGAHPNAQIAFIRALTELAQSRAVDIQGVREDLLPADAPSKPSSRHTQRIQKIEPKRWMLQQAGIERPFREIVSTEHDDIADDIRLIVSEFMRRGIERAVVVDFTEPDGFAVVRVLVPGLEFWSIDQGKLGQRAIQFWRQHAC